MEAFAAHWCIAVHAAPPSPHCPLHGLPSPEPLPRTPPSVSGTRFFPAFINVTRRAVVDEASHAWWVHRACQGSGRGRGDELMRPHMHGGCTGPAGVGSVRGYSRPAI